MQRSRREFVIATSALLASGAALAGCESDSQNATGATAAAKEGWWMPAEETEHSATWMCFPSSRAIWGGELEGVQSDIADIALAISEFEPVNMLVRPRAKATAKKLLGSEVALYEAPVDDLWARDTLPLFLVDSERKKLAAGRVRFNGWGKKQRYKGDTQLAGLVAEQLKIPLINSGVTGEGGGLEVDGSGTILAARSSWVNKNRNPGLSESQIGARLKKTLDAKRVLWVDGIKGQDITDGHVDTLARFIDPETILIEKTASTDIWSRVAAKTKRQLQSARTLDGKPYEFVTLQQPAQLPRNSDTFLSSYVNYLVCNGGVIAPKFGDRKADERAKATLQDAFPDREIVQIRIDSVADGGGGIHCATQQQPKV